MSVPCAACAEFYELETAVEDTDGVFGAVQSAIDNHLNGVAVSELHYERQQGFAVLRVVFRVMNRGACLSMSHTLGVGSDSIQVALDDGFTDAMKASGFHLSGVSVGRIAE